MRIAIIAEQVNKRGGQERAVAELVTRLSRRHEVHLFCFEADDLQQSQAIVHKMWCPFRLPTARSLWSLFASSIAIGGDRFDAVMSQGGNSLSQNCVLVHTCHALRMKATREREWSYRPPNPLTRLLQRVRRWLFLQAEGRAVKRCRGTVMTVSRLLKQYVIHQHGLDADDVVVCENGVDHEAFHPGLRERHREPVRAQLSIPQNAFVALFLGGRWFDKGLPYLVEALCHLHNPDIHVVIVGYGDVEFFDRFARDHGVRDQIRFVQPTDSPQKYYAMADCFAFPTDAEGFPLVSLEATASGLPLITTPMGGAEYLVEDGVTGYTIEPEAGAIADKLAYLAEHRELARQMGQAAHQRALGFSWDRQAQTIEHYLQEWFAGRESR